jgi:hypothetical protein
MTARKPIEGQDTLFEPPVVVELKPVEVAPEPDETWRDHLDMDYMVPVVVRSETSQDAVDPTPETVRIPTLQVGDIIIERLVERDGQSARNRFLKKKGFIPYKEAEQGIGNKTLKVDVTSISGKAQMKYKAVGASLAVADRAKWHANEIKETLEEAVLVLDPDGDHIPDADIIRGSHPVKERLTYFLRARENFDQQNWHPVRSGPRNRPGQSKWNRKNEQRLAQIMRSIEKEPSDEALIKLWKMAYRSNKSRAEFWDDQLESVKEIDLVNAVRSGL